MNLLRKDTVDGYTSLGDAIADKILAKANDKKFSTANISV